MLLLKCSEQFFFIVCCFSFTQAIDWNWGSHGMINCCRICLFIQLMFRLKIPLCPEHSASYCADAKTNWRRMVQMMGIVVMLNVECFTSANIGYIFRYDMCEGREITSCAPELSMVPIVNVRDRPWSQCLCALKEGQNGHNMKLLKAFLKGLQGCRLLLLPCSPLVSWGPCSSLVEWGEAGQELA